MGDLELIFDGALARIRFNAPARRNALNRAIWRALAEACAAIAARAEALAVVVEGAGGHFSAGADIAEFDDRLSRRRGDARLCRRDRRRL